MTRGHTSLQLTTALTLHKCTNEAFGSVVAANAIPPLANHFPIFYIVNSSTESQVAGHWILLYIHSPNSAVEYFDPLHNSPAQYSSYIDNYLKAYSHPYYITNAFKVQPSDSFNCGLFCCFVADKRCQNISLSEIMTMFDKEDLVYNDDLVVNYFRNHILSKSWRVNHDSDE